MRRKVVLVYRDISGEIAEETVWTEPIGNGQYQVDNIPFFAPNLAYKDIISIEEDENELYFKSLIEVSGHSTVQIIFFKHDKNKEHKILQELERIGCHWEGMKGGRYYAIDVPPEVDYSNVRSILKREEQRSILDFREACLAQ
ncbi:MAG: hypothetical protein JWQ34_308 [Mucilaginibacter sp.]|uniref:DUF4265 domain-containing protein n=1 Tax=Mucilaginibacter sp. TaxID=1882438 RepID=UPI0026177848|nr:DUF4265 domain-containing protein [Mucilaginibacter sp.]MDB5002083.1 hypothetical protein [Mucilaginibacter sp.]